MAQFKNRIGWTQQACDEVWIKDCFNPNGLGSELRKEFENVFYMATDHRMIVSHPKRFDKHQFEIVNDICKELEYRIDSEKCGELLAGL